MSKPRTPNQRKRYSELIKRLKQYAGGVMSIYEKHNLEASMLVGFTDYTGENGEPFSFDNYPEIKSAAEAAELSFVSDMSALINRGTSLEWENSNHVQDLLANDVLGTYKASPNAKTVSYYQKNSDHLKAFQQRTEHGMNLSKRLWKQGKQYKQALEETISVAIEKGMSAPQLAQKVTKYLKDYESIKKAYKKKFGKNLKSVNVHYASMRLAVSEINMAYRTAEQTRWKQMDFIVGYEIKTQGKDGKEHISDVCDSLAGKYPKTFKWVGWHPMCRCIAIPILNTEDEFWSLETTKSVNEITDVPKSHKDWIEDNRDRILQAKKRGTLPYWVRDNYKVGYGKIKPMYNDVQQPEKQTLSVFEIAKQRHAQRTKEHEDELIAWWNEHKRKDAIKRAADLRHSQRDTDEILHRLAERRANYKYATKIYEYMQGISDVDTQALKQTLHSGDYNKMLTEAYSLRNIGKEILGLKYIVNPMQAVKSFSLNDIKIVNQSVKNKLDSIQHLSLEKQKKILEDEKIYVVDASYLKPHTLYPTSNIAYEAYSAQLQIVDNKILLTQYKQKFNEFSAYKTKSAKYKQLVSDLNDALQQENFADATAIINELEANKQKIELSRSKVVSKNAKADNIDFGSECFTQERRNNAIWDKSDGSLADRTLIDTNAKAWKSATTKEQDYIFEYTHHYCDVNEPLQLRRYGNHQDKTRFIEKVDNITSYINRCELPSDMWFTRGDDYLSVIESRLKFAGNKMPSNLNDLVGMVMQEGGFMSTGSRKGKGFSNKSVILNIYAPKGTKAAYVEPFSDFGNGAGRSWTGNERFSTYSNEHETLFQRGTKMRITKVYTEGSKTYIDCEVIGQEIRDLSYIPDSTISIY